MNLLSPVRKAAHKVRQTPVLLIVVSALTLGLVTGAAYAYFTSTGSGSGAATTGTMSTATLAVAGSPTAPLLPGGSAGDLTFSVTNNNSFAVSLVSATPTAGTITFDTPHGGCGTTDSHPVVTVSVPSGDLPKSIPAHTTQTIDLASAVTMDVAATSNCQGATISVPVSITVHSS